MSLTKAFRSAHKRNPAWGYRELAEYLHADINTLRGLNGRLKLPIPVRPKAPDGESKASRGDRTIYGKKIASQVTRLNPPKKAITLSTVTIASGRKQYGSYLKLL